MSTVAVTKTSPATLHPSRPPFWKVWWTAARPHTLTASISPVLVGYWATVAYGGTEANPSSQLLNAISWRWFAFCLLIQLGTNLHNDYADFVLGADDDKRLGQPRATQKKWVTPFQMAATATSCLTVALLLGISLIQLVSSSISSDSSSTSSTTTTLAFLWFIILSSIFNAFAYTGGNCYPFSYLGVLRHFSIAYSGLGDVVCFLYFGLVATLMIPYMWWSIHKNNSAVLSTFHPLAWTLWSILAVQVGCFASAILVVNNIRDRHTDKVAHKLTTTVRLGVAYSRYQYAVLTVTPYLLVLFSKKYLHNDDFTMLPLMSLPFLQKHLHAVTGAELDGPNLNPHVGGTAKIEFLFCNLHAISLYLVHTHANDNNAKSE